MFTILGFLCAVAAFVFALIILIDAFKNAVWKGIVGFLCGLYLLYYAIAEFQHEKKGMIIAGWLISIALSVVFQVMGAAAAATSGTPTAP